MNKFSQTKHYTLYQTHMILAIIMFFLIAPLNAQSTDQAKPNIVLCLADDWGWPHAGAYGDQVSTPHFDRLANEGILFEQAYVTSPSCTPSRNSLITGKYHWELGPGANLWSTLPTEHQSFIHLLSDNGYITGRTKAKTWGPGNIKPWIAEHGSHPAGTAFDNFDQFLNGTEAGKQPFFFWLSTSDPHRDYEKGSGKASGIDPSKVHLFEHFPKSDEIRNDVADYYYEVQRWDSLVGTVLTQLEKKGLLENTIVIMTGDHGMPFPRCKGNLYDSGVRVPFAIRWGREIKNGRRLTDYISFADLAPTLLEIAEIDIPEDMTGKSFLPLLTSHASGRIQAEERSEIVFGKERHVPAQEKENMGGYPSRGYRNDDYLYIRNYQPEWWPAGTGEIGNTNYPDQWYADCDGGPTKDYIIENKDKDAAHALAYRLSFAKRPAEELYDLSKDPHQVNNVADQEEYREILDALRNKLQQRLEELNDPRVQDPVTAEFDKHPYLGGGGGKKTN